MLLKLAIFLLIGLTVRFTEGNGLNVIIQEAPNTGIDESSSLNVLSADELCAKLNCGQGEQCDFSESEPKCKCNEDCETPKDERLKVCSSSNRTYESECHFYREKCWCKRQDNKCTDRNAAYDGLDYFGACKYIDVCTKEQMEVFPKRIQVWLDEVLNILNDRHDLDKKKYGHLVQMAHKMKNDKVEKYWTCGVVFEFCQLDKSHDGLIEFDELKALVAPIKSLENCIQPFLKQCDTNNDSKISDSEWVKCLDLSDDDLVLLRKVCKP